MNKNVIFSGEVKAVSVKTGSGWEHQLITLEIEDTEYDKVNKTTSLVTKAFYIDNWSSKLQLKPGDKGHFICELTYKKVTSNKAVYKDDVNTNFDYGKFGFRLTSYTPDNSHIIKWFNKKYKNWKPAELPELSDEEMDAMFLG